MDWDRRAFIKLAVGGVIGIHASPLVYKLMDDTAIWTQNWPWVPVPEDGAVAYAATVNPQTGTGAMAKMVDSRVAGNRAIRVEGNADHPLSKGGVIPQDASALQLLYNDDIRVKTPLVRDKKTGQAVRISWAEALDMLAGQLAETAKQGKAHTVAALAQDASSVSGALLDRFMTAYGSPNVAYTPDPRETLSLAGLFMLGQPMLGFDLDNADYVISFGTPLLENFGSPVAIRKAFTSWRGFPKNPGTLVQVEPRISVTASQADHWLACRAGTEATVALAMCAIMVEEGIYDKEVVGNSFGFESQGGKPGFKDFVIRNFNPKRIAKLTGIPLEKLVKVTLAFAKSKKGVAVCGPGNSGDPGRLYDFMCVLALNALKGNLGKPGGVVVQQPMPLKALGPELKDPKAQALGDLPGPLGGNNPNALAEAALDGRPYSLSTLILCGGNFAYNGPQANVMHKLIKKTPFVVAITPYLDETAKMADLVLPSTHWLEGWGDSTTPYASARSAYGLHRPLVEGVAQAKDSSDIILALAQRLGGAVAQAVPFKSTPEAMAARTQDMGDFEKLAEKSYWVQDKVAYGPIKYQTPSGKFEFLSQMLVAMTAEAAGGEDKIDALLHQMGVMGGSRVAFLPNWQPPKALLTQDNNFPFIMQAVPSLRTSWGGDATTPYMVKVLPDSMLADKDKLVVEMNPVTAHKFHFHEGELVQVESRAGTLIARLHLNPGAQPDMVFAPVGLGHDAFGFQVSGKGMNFNRAAEVTSDPMSGLPVWDLTAVSVIKARG